LRKQLEHRGAPPSEVSRAEEILDPEALTIGFARRFATYKRATLMFHNMERITRILDDRQRPLQIIFAGKAHPHDNPGKDLIRQIIHAERNPLMRSRMVFIEDYDMVVARYLVQGVDIWLNTPRRPLEASGTSGMKASVNGALNLSILDGWWAEAYSAENGWSIGNGEEYTDTTYQDEVESNALYDLLEKEIIPLFYTRGNDNLPRGWISKMKSAIRNIGPVFNTNRMVRDYTEEMYLAAGDQYHKLIQSKGERAKKLAEWKTKLHDQWPRMRILDIKSDTKDGFKVGDTLKVSVVLSLGEIEPPDIDVQLYYGQLNAHDEIEVPQNVTMKFCGNRKDGTAEFSGSMTFSASGRMGHTIRILPHHRDLQNPFRMGLVKWATQ
jgi:starch phosphorylase